MRPNHNPNAEKAHGIASPFSRNRFIFNAPRSNCSSRSVRDSDEATMQSYSTRGSISLATWRLQHRTRDIAGKTWLFRPSHSRPAASWPGRAGRINHWKLCCGGKQTDPRIEWDAGRAGWRVRGCERRGTGCCRVHRRWIAARDGRCDGRAQDVVAQELHACTRTCVRETKRATGEREREVIERLRERERRERRGVERSGRDTARRIHGCGNK